MGESACLMVSNGTIQSLELPKSFNFLLFNELAVVASNNSMIVSKMQLRTLVILGGTSCIAALMAAAVAMYVSYTEFSKTHLLSIEVSTIGEASFNLSILTGEYLLYGGERAEVQWLGKHESLGRLLTLYSARNEKINQEIEGLRNQHTEAKEVFIKLVDTSMHSLSTKKIASHTPGPLEVRLATQLLTTLHTMVGVSSRMTARLEEGLKKTIFNLVKILGAIFVSIFLILVGGWTLIAWRVALPVTMLHKGIDTIATGNLNHLITGLHNDEIGFIAGRINAMAHSLKETLVKRDSLQEEIVQRQKAEKELKNTLAALALANEELQQFTYSVSHDLRAPLRSIDGFSQALMDDYAEKLDGEALQYLQYQREGAQELSTLIDALLKLSRSTQGEMEFEVVNLSEIARDVTQQLQMEAVEDKTTIDIQPGIKAYADPRLMRVVMENLLGNAWKFSRNKESPHIEVKAEEQDDKLLLSVRDNGAGFNMEFADKLFAPFQRLHRIDEFEGTGIGLSTVQRIVARHGGRVWGEGNIGEGATISIEIPSGGQTSD